MATVSQVEGTPEEYPTEDDDAIWQRIEAYCAHRWTAREVVWIVDSPHDWRPPLAPAQITLAELWTGAAYEPVDLFPEPLGGLRLPGFGPYRITATVGADNPAPAAVLEAFARLKAYLEGEKHKAPAGASSYTLSIGSSINWNFRRSPEWIARAMSASGAADLLRPYRRA